MTRKIIPVLLALIFMLLSFAACKSSEGGVTDNTGNNSPNGGNIQTEKDNLIFSVNVLPNIICNDQSTLSDILGDLQMTVFNITYRAPMIYTDEVAPIKHEIVIGKTNRDISVTAYRYLERIEEEDEEVSYLIYSDGSSLAIAYDEDRYHLNAAAIRALEHLDTLFYGKSEIIIEKGTVDYLSFDALEYQEELDRIDSDKKWKEFEAKANELGGDGAAIVAAVKDYYARVCTDDIVSWLANLYDPAVGGFYFSNGGRDTPGFLPDAESTSQAIGELESSGMLNAASGNKYINGLPEWFRNQVVAFLKKLQDPETGYFYHPQWSKEEVNAHLSRRSRDMTKACSTLRSFGSAPTYDTPSGTKGDGIRWDGIKVDEVVSPSSLTTYLHWSCPSLAVSKVVPTADVAVPDHLLNDKAFIAYLDEQAALNAAGKRSFYSIGNEIGSQVSEIKKRDKDLAESGADYQLGDILIEWYTEHQNKETGLWDQGVNYDATNALLKIVGTYDAFGYIFPRADLALQSCLVMATSSDEALTVCYVYNIWFAIEELIDSVNKYSTSEADKEYANSVRKIILDMAPEAIRISAEKQLQFKQSDGSFSFTAEGNCVTSQGMRVGVPGEGDGDVNATVICLGGTIGRCLATMGLDSYAPGFYTEADRLRFIAILEDLGPVIKDDIDVPIDYDEFDDEPLNNPPQNITCDNLKGGTLEVVEDPDGESSDDRALLFENFEGDYEAVQISSQSGALGATCFVFESDFYIAHGTPEKTFMQIYLQEAVYMINVVEENGKIKLIETSSASWTTAKQQDLGVRLNFNEWFNIKIQYFVGDHDNVRIKVFINNSLIAISDNYYDAKGDKLTGIGTPKDRMDFVNIIGLSTQSVKVYLDNTACYKTNDIYKPLSANDKQPNINADPPESDLEIHDFDQAISEDITTLINDSIIEREVIGDDGVLKIGATEKGKTPSMLTMPINLRLGKARTAVLDAYITVSQDASGTLGRFWFAENELNVNPTFCFDLAVRTVDGENRVVLVEAPQGKPGAIIDGVAMPLGEEFHLRVEYYEQESTMLVYIDNVLVGMSAASCSNAVKYSAKALVLTGVAESTGYFTIDDMIFEKDALDFEASTSGGESKVYHDFDTLPEGATLLGGALLDDGVARLCEMGAHIKLPLIKRGSVDSATIITTDVIYTEGSGSYIMALTDELGKEIIAFEFYVNNNGVDIYEYYSGGRGILIGTAGLRDYSFKLTIKYYYKEAVCNIFIGSEPVAETALTWLYDRDGISPSYFTVTQISDKCNIAIDNTSPEKVIALYDNITPVIAPEKPAINSEENYEQMSQDNLSDNITSKLSLGASVSIKAMMNKGKATKVLAFTTVQGANDSVSIDMAESAKLQGAKVTVFETDILLDAKRLDNKHGVEIYFRNSSDNNANKFIIYSQEDDNINVSDYYSGKGESSYVTTWPVYNGEMFNLRMEYIAENGKMTINIFVNGTYVGKSTVFCPDDKPMAAEEISRVLLYTHSGFVGRIYLDNTKFYHSNTPTEVPSRDPGDNFFEGGLTFEGMTSIWVGIDKGGTANELSPIDKLIVRNTSVTNASKGEKYTYLDIFTDFLGKGVVFGKTTNDYHGEMYLKNLGGEGNCFVFDTQMQLGSVTGLEGNGEKWLLKFAFTDSYRTLNSQAMPTLHAPLEILSNDDGSFVIAGKTVQGDAWINLTLEYYPEDYALVVYLDGKVVAVNRVETKLDSFGRVAVLLREEAASAEVKFDNISAYVKEKAFTQTLPEDHKDPIAEIQPVKGGASGIVVLIHDDGDLQSCSTLDKLYLKYGLVGDVAMIANRVYDKETGTATADAAKWQMLLDTGRWQVVNHSYSHSAYGTEQNGEFIVDEEKLIEEIITSGDMLRAAFPGEKVLGYAYPGFGALNSTYGDALYNMARKLIRDYYVVAREMGGGSVDFGNEIWEFFSAESMSTSRVESTVNAINNITNGGTLVLYTHKVGDDGDITASAMEEVLIALNEKVAAGKIWNTHFADAAIYRREAASATVKSKIENGNIVLTLTDNLNNDIYNLALTIKIKVDSSWQAVKVTQGDNVSYATVTNGYALVDVIPDAGDATVTSISLSALPTPPVVTPPESPDLGFDDDDQEEEEGEEEGSGTTPSLPGDDGEFGEVGQIPENPDGGETNDSDGWT